MEKVGGLIRIMGISEANDILDWNKEGPMRIDNADDADEYNGVHGMNMMEVIDSDDVVNGSSFYVQTHKNRWTLRMTFL